MTRPLLALTFSLCLQALAAQTPDAPLQTLLCNSPIGLAKAWHQKANGYFLETDFPAAIVFFKKSIGADSTFCDPHHGLSIVYSTLGNLDSAVFFARRAFELHPVDKLKFHHATTLVMHAKFEEAEPLFQELLKSEYQKALVHQSLAQIFLFRERFDDAIKHAYISLALCEQTDPQTAGADYLILGSAWLWQREPDKARPLFEKALALGTNVPATYRKAAGM